MKLNELNWSPVCRPQTSLPVRLWQQELCSQAPASDDSPAHEVSSAHEDPLSWSQHKYIMADRLLQLSVFYTFVDVVQRTHRHFN